MINISQISQNYERYTTINSFVVTHLFGHGVPEAKDFSVFKNKIEQLSSHSDVKANKILSFWCKKLIKLAEQGMKY